MIGFSFYQFIEYCYHLSHPIFKPWRYWHLHALTINQLTSKLYLNYIHVFYSFFSSHGYYSSLASYYFLPKLIPQIPSGSFRYLSILYSPQSRPNTFYLFILKFSKTPIVFYTTYNPSFLYTWIFVIIFSSVFQFLLILFPSLYPIILSNEYISFYILIKPCFFKVWIL